MNLRSEASVVGEAAFGDQDLVCTSEGQLSVSHGCCV